MLTSIIHGRRARSVVLVLRSNGQILDDVASELGLFDGMLVTLLYDDPGEEFEMDGVLGHIADPNWQMWMALYDQKSYRRILG